MNEWFQGILIVFFVEKKSYFVYFRGSIVILFYFPHVYVIQLVIQVALFPDTEIVTWVPASKVHNFTDKFVWVVIDPHILLVFWAEDQQVLGQAQYLSCYYLKTSEAVLFVSVFEEDAIYRETFLSALAFPQSCKGEIVFHLLLLWQLSVNCVDDCAYDFQDVLLVLVFPEIP